MPGTPGKETAAVFSEYAKAICASLKSAWKDGRVPAGCVNRALFNLEDFVTLQLAKELGAVLIDHALFEVYKPQSALQEDDSMQ